MFDAEEHDFDDRMRDSAAKRAVAERDREQQAVDALLAIRRRFGDDIFRRAVARAS